MSDIQEVRQVILGQLAAERPAMRQLTRDTSLADGGLELTSLQLLRILVTLEEHFDIEIEDIVIMNAKLNTVDDIVDVVFTALSAQQATA